MKKLSLFLFISFISSSFPFAQTEGQEILSEFSVIQQGEQMRVILTIEAGTSSCQGIELEKKVGNGEFSVIDYIPGICGGSEFEETYILFDETPESGEALSYRVNLGNVGRSEILTIYFVPLDEGIAVYPNPAHTVLNVLIDKPFGEECKIEITNSQGQVIYVLEKWIQSSITISCESWLNGLYTIKVRSARSEWVRQFVRA